MIWWEVLLLRRGWLSIPSFISRTTHRLVPHFKLACWMGAEFTSVRGGTLAHTIKSTQVAGTSVSQNRSPRNCTLKTIRSMGVWLSCIRYVAERRKVGWKVTQENSGFGDIVDRFLYQGGGSGNRTSSTDGLL